MKKVRILGTGSFIPERVVPNAYFESLVNTSNEWIVSRTGIKERRMVLPGQALSDLAVPAAKKALEMAEPVPGGTGPDYYRDLYGGYAFSFRGLYNSTPDRGQKGRGF